VLSCTAKSRALSGMRDTSGGGFGFSMSCPGIRWWTLNVSRITYGVEFYFGTR
jgi:hypothetical protein